MVAVLPRCVLDVDTIVELDRRAYHAEERRLRDNDAAADGMRTLRYGWADVAAPCITAAQVARALRAGGWDAHPRRCKRHGCSIRRTSRRPVP